jgi:hypothetical protein
MKTAILAALATSLLFTSCTTYRKVIDSVTDNQILVAPTAALISSVIFEKAVSDEDRAEKAKIVFNLSERLKGITFDAKPTREDLEQFIINSLPNKPHWVVLAATLGSYYESTTKGLSDDDVVKAAKLINEIALGLSLSSQKYI